MRGKKTDRGVVPSLDEPIDATCLRHFETIQAHRRVELPPAAYVWEKFVAYLHEKGSSYANRGALLRRWRVWVESEKPVAAALAPPSPRTPVAGPAVPSVEATERAQAARVAEGMTRAAATRAALDLLNFDSRPAATPAEEAPASSRRPKAAAPPSGPSAPRRGLARAVGPEVLAAYGRAAPPGAASAVA